MRVLCFFNGANQELANHDLLAKSLCLFFFFFKLFLLFSVCFGSLKTKKGFYFLWCLHTKWLYKYLYNSLNFVSWAIKSNIFTVLLLKTKFTNSWS